MIDTSLVVFILPSLLRDRTHNYEIKLVWVYLCASDRSWYYKIGFIMTTHNVPVKTDDLIVVTAFEICCNRANFSCNIWSFSPFFLKYIRQIKATHFSNFGEAWTLASNFGKVWTLDLKGGGSLRVSRISLGQWGYNLFKFMLRKIEMHGLLMKLMVDTWEMITTSCMRLIST